MAVATQDIFIGRQSIIDRGWQAFAYELLFRADQQNCAEISDDLAATATVLSYVISELGLETALGPYLGFVNLDARMLMSDALEMLPSEKFVLEVLETVEITPDIVSRCHQLKDKGYQLAMDDFVTFEERHRPLLDLADIVKVDIKGMDDAALRKTIHQLRQWPCRLLAEKIENEDQAKQCLDLGFDLFQGYYFTKPTIVAGKKLSQSELSIIRLLGLILQDADSSELEGVFKSEPGLTLNLLRITNSAATCAPQKITSLRHAITVLGRRQLQRWLQLLLYTNPSSGGSVNSPLLLLAATRGRFMELLAGDLFSNSRDLMDRAFMTGTISLMPALLHVPIGDILASLNVARDMREALETRSGMLGRLLELTERMEENNIGACDRLTVKLPGVTLGRVSIVLSQALAWANNIGRETT